MIIINAKNKSNIHIMTLHDYQKRCADGEEDEENNKLEDDNEKLPF